MAADSTMLRMVNLLMALSLGVHREQLLQRMGLTWPRPFLLRPLFFLFLTMIFSLVSFFFFFFFFFFSFSFFSVREGTYGRLSMLSSSWDEEKTGERRSGTFFG
jgi:hypothetical protein